VSACRLPASRGSIIETLFKRGYMERCKKSLVPTEKGLALNSVVKTMRIADFLGDSLALSVRAQSVDADVILFAGVHFMAETAKVLCPEKKVLIPCPEAGCSLADSCPAAEFAAFKAKYPGHRVVSYVNTTVSSITNFSFSYLIYRKGNSLSRNGILDDDAFSLVGHHNPFIWEFYGCYIPFCNLPFFHTYTPHASF